MKNLCFLFALCLINFSYGQTKLKPSEPFEFLIKYELAPQFVLVDNKNIFLLSVINVDGMQATRQMIVRKFDQANKLVEKFTYDFPLIDYATLFKYLGYTETKEGKVVVFTESFSGRAKQNKIYKHEFDKTTSEFISTELLSSTIISGFKSGEATMEMSENGNFIGINYRMHRGKKEPEKNLMLMLDPAGNIVWQKEFSFADELYTSAFTITNSGKAVYLRSSKGFKHGNYFVLATQEGQEEKTVDMEVTFHAPTSISVGTQEYVLAFNYPSKGLIGRTFSELLLYDLNNGKTIANTPVEGYNSKMDLEVVSFRKVAVQNNEIHVFTEALAQKQINQTKTSEGSTPSIPEVRLEYGPGYLHILSLDGALKTFDKIAVKTTDVSLRHSYGLIDIKGTYYLTTGSYHEDKTHFGGFFQLNTSTGYEKTPASRVNFEGEKYVHQLIHYYPDSKKWVFAKVIDENNMALVNASDVTF